MDKKDLLSWDIPALRVLLSEWGEPNYRAQQLFTWFQQKGVTDFAAMSNLPLSLQKRLSEETVAYMPKIARRQDAGDTIKLLLTLADGEQIETVLMLYKRQNSRDRATCCVSTQSGCAMGCVFCASGFFKYPRNLSAGEMIAQVLLSATLGQELGYSGISNVVFMGMGEPLANLTNIKQTIELLNNEQGQNIGLRRITISTCGLTPQIYKLADWGKQIGLAVSLHAADQEKRARLMPVAKHYTLPELLAACRYFRAKTGRRVTMEYALFAGINDSKRDAEQLATLLADQNVLVNIIPANTVIEAGICASNRELIEIFCAILQRKGLEVVLRERRGAEIEAACGQLRKPLNK